MNNTEKKWDNTNSGVLFTKKKKEGQEKYPDYEGSLDVNGKKFDIAGWNRVSKKGNPFISLKISEPKEETY